MGLEHEVGDDLIDLTGRVGEAGESFFNTLTNSGGGVANKAHKDRLGWDFHVQLSRTGDWQAHYSLDTRPPEASCFVQVKATTRPIRSWRLKLSTWERLAKERRPVFFVIFIYDKDDLDRPQHGYVVHLGEELLGRALKALREVPDEKLDALNQTELSFTWGKDDELPSLTGRELVATIQRYIGPDIGTYEAKKADLLKKIGYEKGRFKISFQVSNEHTSEEIATFSLGLRDGLKGKITRSVEQRFEIEKPTIDGPRLGEVEIQLPSLSPDGHGFAIFEGSASGEKVRIPCDIFGGEGFALVLSPRQRGLRMVFDGGEVTAIPQNDEDLRIELTYTLLNPDEVIPLARAARRAKIVNLLAEPGGCRLWLEIGGNRIEPPLELSGAELGDAQYFAEILLCAARVAAAADVDPNTDIEPTKLIEQDQALIQTGTRNMLAIKGRLLPGKLRNDEQTAMLFASTVTIGSTIITSVVAVTGAVLTDPDTGNFKINGRPEILKCRSADADLTDAARSELLSDAIVEVRRRGSTKYFFLRGDNQEFDPKGLVYDVSPPGSKEQ